MKHRSWYSCVRRICAPSPESVRLTATLKAIVNGHKQSQINELMPWNYNVKV